MGSMALLLMRKLNSLCGGLQPLGKRGVGRPTLMTESSDMLIYVAGMLYI